MRSITLSVSDGFDELLAVFEASVAVGVVGIIDGDKLFSVVGVFSKERRCNEFRDGMCKVYFVAECGEIRSSFEPEKRN